MKELLISGNLTAGVTDLTTKSALKKRDNKEKSITPAVKFPEINNSSI